jgi:hypothetical protein
MTLYLTPPPPVGLTLTTTFFTGQHFARWYFLNASFKQRDIMLPAGCMIWWVTYNITHARQIKTTTARQVYIWFSCYKLIPILIFFPFNGFNRLQKGSCSFTYFIYTICSGVCSSIAGWGIVLQARKSRVWFPIRPLGLFTDLILPLHYDLGVNSDSNRNEYQGYLWGGKGGQGVGLTTFPPTWVECLENLAVSTSWSPKGLFRPV